MADGQKEKLRALSEKLIQRGEDSQELNFWQEIFDDLEPDEQKHLLAIFSSELAKLESVKKER